MAYSRASVESMVTAIDQGDNCALLKYRYFGSYSPQALRLADGLSLVKEALTREKPPSRRWLLLAQVAAFAEMRAPGGAPGEADAEDAYRLYGRIFDQTGLVGTDADAFEAAISDYVTVLTFRRVEAGTPFWARASPVLLSALDAYLGLLDSEYAPRVTIPWAVAVDVTGAGDSALKVVDTFEARHSDHEKLECLCALAAACQVAAPERSLALLQRARVMLPANNPVRRGRFYAQLVNLLRLLKHFPEAVEVQRGAVRETGHGQAVLMELLLRAGEADELRTLLGEACAGSVPDGEMLDGADRLEAATGGAPASKPVAHAAEKKLLRAYLDRHRGESTTGTSRATAGLAAALIADGETSAARELLDAWNPPAIDEDWHARIYRSAIAELRHTVEKSETAAADAATAHEKQGR